MTSPPPADPSLQPRQRPSIETLAKITTEEDLWDLSDLPADDTPDVAQVQVTPRKGIPSATVLPLSPAEELTRRDSGNKEHPPVLHVQTTPRHHLSQSANVERLGRVRPAPPPQAQQDANAPQAHGNGANMLEDTFDNLEDWDLTDDVLAEGTLPAPQPIPLVSSPGDETVRLPLPEPAAPPPPTVVEPAAAAAPAQDEFATTVAPGAKPVSLRPKLGLTKLEVAGLVSLALLLLGVGYWVYANSLSRLLSQAGQIQTVEFPVHGNHVTLTAVATYWREPIKNGSQVEAVRRGVVLIPVTEVTLTGGPGAIRALVHNDNGVAVGDPITRQIDGQSTLVLPATDGFEDISMHAAYRTGQTKPWTVHIFEAPSATAQGKDFKKLLEVPISTTKR